MKRRTEVRLEMGQRALEFSRAHPSSSPGYAIALKQLEEQLALGTQLADQQRQGTAEVRTATLEKDRHRRSIRRGHLVHISGVAQRAAIEDPELAQKFDLPRLPTRGLAFRAAARAMIEQAEQQKELLSKYGLVDEALQNARQSIDQLDNVVERGAEGRRVHVGASAGLVTASSEVLRLVKILDGFNRFRFAGDLNLLAGWMSASNVVGPAVSGGRGSSPVTAPESGQVKPAA